MPKILETLELHNEGMIASVYLDKNWIKQTGATVNECDDIVNMVLSIAIVEVVAYFRIVDNKTRVSLRSKGDIDVSIIAQRFDGGGHKNAAGLSLDTLCIDTAKKLLVDSF
jgi:phosphoesterase RecJ-like protein